MRSFSELFRLMVDRRATHFHLIPGSPVMVRTANTLAPLDTHILSPADTAKMANALLTDKQKRIFEERLEVDFSYSIPGLSRYRINVFRQRGSIGMVIATNPPSPPTFEELGLPDVLKNTVSKATSGLVVVSGPKRSGKSSTLAAIVNYILETRAVQLVTFENPIEYLLKNKKGIICQRELGTDFKSFKMAFNSLRHQACDILVCTEFDNQEIIRNILNLAAGGSMVVVTTQAPSIQVVIERILDVFPPHQRQQALSLLSVSLTLVVSQTLLNKASGGGQIAAFEILVGAPPIRTLIREDKLSQVQSFMASHGREFGMQTQEQAFRSLLKKNIIYKEEALAKSVRQEELKKILTMSF